MFEAGKRVKRIKIDPRMRSSYDCEVGDVVTVRSVYKNVLYSDFIADTFLAKETNKYYLQSDFEPIDDAPAPRMVTTCDIGARVVRGRDWAYGTDASQGGENPTGTIKGQDGEGWCWVEWDNKKNNAYKIGVNGKYDLYYADEQPEKESECRESGCGKLCESFEFECEECLNIRKEEQAKIDDGDDKIPSDPLPGIASVMFGSKPRLITSSREPIAEPENNSQINNWCKERDEILRLCVESDSNFARKVFNFCGMSSDLISCLKTEMDTNKLRQPIAEPESLVKAREAYHKYKEMNFLESKGSINYIRELEARVKELEGK